jgi:type IV secretory pathway TraG/TraD family ATPase VirD4
MIQHNEPGRFSSKKMFEDIDRENSRRVANKQQQQPPAAAATVATPMMTPPPPPANSLFDSTLFLIVAVIGFWFSYIKIRQWFGRQKGISDTSHGTARFAEKAEMKKLFHTRGQPLNAGELLIGHADRRHDLKIDKERASQHTVVLGGTGAGKSRAVFLPACANARATSFVATDPKSELWNTTSGLHERAIRFAPREPDNSLCFNWIPLCSNARLADKCAATIIGETTTGDSFWINGETSLLAAIFSHCAIDDVRAVATPAAAYELLTSSNEILISILTNSKSDYARRKFQGYIDNEKNQGSFKGGAADKMKFLGDPDVQRMTSSNLLPPDFGALRKQPHAIYWCLDEADITELRALTALFFTVALEQLKREKEQVVPAFLLLDEFANIGTLKAFYVDITTLRGRGVGVVAGLQSLSQLSHVYGQKAGEIIWDNFTTKIMLPGLSYDTAESVSKALGETTIVENKTTLSGKSWFGYKDASETQQAHARRLMTADEIRRMQKGKALVVSGNDAVWLIDRLHYDAAPVTAKAQKCGAIISTDPAVLSNIAATNPTSKTKNKGAKKPPPPPPPADLDDSDMAALIVEDDGTVPGWDGYDIIPPTPPAQQSRALIPLRLKRREKTPWDDFDEHTILQVEPLPPPPTKA